MISKSRFQFRSLINRSPEEVFGWHLKDRMLERCIPPYESISILNSEGRPNVIGSKIAFRAKFLGLFSTTVNLEYTEFVPDESFTIIAKDGRLKELKYKTAITPQSEHTSEIIDSFAFSHNFPRIFNPLINRILQKRLFRIVNYKHEMIDHDIGMLRKYPFERPLKVLVSGSHGLIGKNLAYFLEFAGHDVWHLSRFGSKEEKTLIWDPKTGECDSRQFEGFDVVVHLAGENIGEGRWTKKKKERVLKSRSKGTENLVQIFKGLKNPPKAFISASAVGYYGNRGAEVVDETSGPGKGLFISQVCEEWERASRELEEKGVRVVHTRFGMVLSSAGGALKKMMTPFKWGLGGKLGNGHQYVSWVAIDDVVGSIYHVMMTPSLQGAVNVVAPNPVPNDILTKKLSKRLNRWIGPPLPEFVIRMILGQKGEELLLTSTRVEPLRLNESGYHFHYPKLTQALEHVV
ncbi:MAG: TIGR01777 family oxidoreductase [Chlamydiia bacterium]|nr:TIGR01777 family oxidoreductase [Chlamydiia bacterium]